MSFRRTRTLLLISLAWLAGGCVLWDDGGLKKPPPSGLIATPVSYYSTPKARYLGTKYKQNLERLAARIVQDPKTASLQFANNISSVGGMGFFTHSATKNPDERYLEVVLATPETFDKKTDFSEKVAQIFANYGLELLGILGADREMYQDRELSGYGLNLAWRTVVTDASSSRVAMARAVIYFQKDQVVKFLRREMKANDLLASAVIFTVEDDGPLQLVSYQPRQTTPDYRPPIREDDLAATSAGSKAPQPASPSAPAGDLDRRVDQSSEVSKSEPAVMTTPAPRVNTPQPQSILESGAAPKLETVEKKPKPIPRRVEDVTKAAKTPRHDQGDANSERLALNRKTEAPSRPLPQTSALPVPEITAPAAKGQSSQEVRTDNRPAAATAIKAPEKLHQPAPSEGKWPGAVESIKSAPTPVPALKNEPIEANIAAEKSPRTSSSIAPVTDRSQTNAGRQSAELKPPQAVVPPVSVQAAVPPQVEKQAPAPAAAANLESRTIPVEQPGAANLAPARPSGTVEKALPKQVPAVKPNAPASAMPPLKPTPKVRAADASTLGAAPAKLPPAKTTDTNSSASSAFKAPELATVPAPAKPLPLTNSIKNEPTSVTPTTTKPAAPLPEKNVKKPVPEQLALLKKPSEAPVDKKPPAPMARKPLEGFIIQIAFSDKAKAQSWAEKMEQRGYAVSVTAAGSEGALRVRLGNFALRDDAERQLQNLKQDGMNGIILNLPQAYRPEVRSSLP